MYLVVGLLKQACAERPRNFRIPFRVSNLEHIRRITTRRLFIRDEKSRFWASTKLRGLEPVLPVRSERPNDYRQFSRKDRLPSRMDTLRDSGRSSLDRLHLPRACRTLRQGLQYSHSKVEYDLYGVIGQGSFASVYRGEHRGMRRVVAVKQIVRAKLNRKLQENLEAEILILQSIEHPNVMRLHEVQTTERHVYLMLEFCPGGDLMHVIKKHGAQSEAQTRVYLVQLAHGLQHLRQRNLIHRDLKPQNLLLSNHHPHGELKIGDFGFARYMQQQDLAETLCGSPLYMAPEILRYHKYDAKADL